MYNKEQASCVRETSHPSAPPLEEPSAPPEENIKTISSIECVICLDFKVS